MPGSRLLREAEPPDGLVVVDPLDLRVDLLDVDGVPVPRIGDGYAALDIRPGVADSDGATAAATRARAMVVSSAARLRLTAADFADLVTRTTAG